MTAQTHLARIPRDTLAPPHTLVLPSWLTPAFARQWLEAGGLAERPRGGQAFSQAERYAAIADGQDWDPRRAYRLAWREEYTGRELAAVAEAAGKGKKGKKAGWKRVGARNVLDGAEDMDNGYDPRRAFWHLAKRAIDDGELKPEAVNELAEQGKSDGWGSALQQLREAAGL